MVRLCRYVNAVYEYAHPRHCPRCKKARKAAKQLTFSRMPPVLIIHLKRFSFKGPFTDKLETLVEFPLKDLDLTSYMPPTLPSNPDKDGLDRYSPQDPRAQMPPYKYELYGVANHFGSLSSGHCKCSASTVILMLTWRFRYRVCQVARQVDVLRRQPDHTC